jgi:hypothetical protein
MNPGMPTSAVVSARNSSALSSSAWCSWRRQRTRSSTFVDQSVSSNARRAAAIAASTSVAVLSGATPICCPVAGLRIGYVAPSLAPLSLPSTSCWAGGLARLMRQPPRAAG